MTILLFIARLLGPFIPYLAVWVAAKRDSRQSAKLKRMQADKEANERINHADVSRGNADADREWLRQRSSK